MPNTQTVQHSGNPSVPAGLIVKIILGLLVLVFLKTTWYSVPAESEAIKLRFGRIVEDRIQPGLHFKLPAGIEAVDIQPVKRQLKLEFGFTTPGASNAAQYGDAQEEKIVTNMVTGDLNAVHVEWVVQYRISDLQKFLYDVREPDETLRDCSESVMREVVGDRTVDEAITVGRLEMEKLAKTKLQAMCDQYGLGTSIDLVQLKGVNPPAPVRPSFDSVNQAQQEREQLINVARGEYNKVVPKAAGQAKQLIAEAEGEALKRVNEAKGDADRFSAVFKAYQQNPDITRRRLYLETMAKVLPRLGKKVIIDDKVSGLVPFLPLGDNGPVIPANTTNRR
jgi:membrane protease subunit HflK